VKKKFVAGIMVTLFLITMMFNAIPLKVSAYTGDPITIGVVGPKGWIQWDGMWEGCTIAKDLINDAGGMVGGDGKTHEVKLVDIDSHAVPVPQPELGIQELLSALEANPDMQFLIGGFRTECVLPMREACMDYAAANDRPIWFLAGAATDGLLGVEDDYDRYMYMFRVTPMSSSSLVTQIVQLLGSLIIPKIGYATGVFPVKTYIVAEDLVWCDSAVEALEDIFLPQLELAGLATHVETARPSAVETSFGSILQDIETKEAKLIIHIFSAVAGASFIKQWGERGTPAVPVGINVESQMQEFYAAIGGYCQYETLMASVGTRTLTNPTSEPLTSEELWDRIGADYGHAPIYTTWGAFDALISLNESCADWYGKACSEMIADFEAEDRWGILGHFKYTQVGVGNPMVGGEGHDVYVDTFAYSPIWPSGSVRGHFPQWQNGIMEVVWPRGVPPGANPLTSADPLPFATKYKLPPFMYSLAESDFAGNSMNTTMPDGAGGYAFFPMPDRVVDTEDRDAVITWWQKTVPWYNLEADMDGNNFITISDVARVAIDWLATP